MRTAKRWYGRVRRLGSTQHAARSRKYFNTYFNIIITATEAAAGTSTDSSVTVSLEIVDWEHVHQEVQGSKEAVSYWQR